MVILYTTHCPKCNVIQKKLTAAKIEYEMEEDLEEISKVCKKAKIDHLPILEVNGKFLTFSEAASWINQGGI